MERNSVYWDMITPRLDTLGKANVTDTTRSAVTREVETAKSVTENATALITAVQRDANLSAQGKRSRLDVITADARQKLEGATREIKRQLALERRFHEERAAWPRSGGTDADREARLANARSDFDRVMSGVGTGRRSARLAFIARNGNDNARELLFRERYPETVYFPSLDDSAADAAAWADDRDKLVRELHPKPGEANRALDALEALGRAGRQIEDIANTAAQTDAQTLEALAQHP